MTNFDPTKWFWFVAGDETRVFSSEIGDYIAVSDPRFMAFTASGGAPSRADDDASLGAYLAPFLSRPSHAGVLDGYRDEQARGVIIQVPFKLIFSLINDVRELKGQARLTAQQARSHVKGFM